MGALLLSFGVIFAPSWRQEPAHGPGVRCPLQGLPILAGITIATAVVHAVSVVVGMSVGAALSTDVISVVAGVAFFGFGLWTLRGDSLSAEEAAKAERSSRSAVLAASGAFFLAELGDKTMLATVTLATTEGAFGTWAGHARHGGGRRPGHRAGQPTRRPPAGAGDQDRCRHLFFVFGAILIMDGLA